MDRRTDGHCHGIIRPFFKRAFKRAYKNEEVLRIGRMKYSDSTIHTKIEITWTTESLMTLGIEISVKKGIEKINIEPLINKIENIIKIWSWRHLNLFGKVTIINSLSLSQLIYRFTVLPTPSKSIMDKIDKILFNYLWENRPHKIAKDVVSNEYQSGGIKMPNIYIKMMH